MNLALPGFLKQQTGQAFVIVAGVMYWFWKEGAPETLWWIVGGCGGLYILGEKLRSTINGKKT
jgi:hypothetical protein